MAEGLEQIYLPFVDYLFNWVENYKKGVVRKNTLKIHMNNITNHISPYFKKIMLRDIPIHSLRHTYAVLMLEAGADMKFVQEQLGHGSIRITSDVYSHITKKIEQRNMEKIESYTTNILGANWGHNKK